MLYFLSDFKLVQAFNLFNTNAKVILEIIISLFSRQWKFACILQSITDHFKSVVKLDLLLKELFSGELWNSNTKINGPIHLTAQRGLVVCKLFGAGGRVENMVIFCKLV